MYFPILAALLAAAVAADVYDVTETQKGLKAGVAIEGSTFLVGEHPGARALYVRDVLELALSLTPTLVLHAFHSSPWDYSALAGPAVYAFMHLRGGLAWRKLLKK